MTTLVSLKDAIKQHLNLIQRFLKPLQSAAQISFNKSLDVNDPAMMAYNSLHNYYDQLILLNTSISSAKPVQFADDKFLKDIVVKLSSLLKEYQPTLNNNRLIQNQAKGIVQNINEAIKTRTNFHNEFMGIYKPGCFGGRVGRYLYFNSKRLLVKEKAIELAKASPNSETARVLDKMKVEWRGKAKSRI